MSSPATRMSTRPSGSDAVSSAAASDNRSKTRPGTDRTRTSAMRSATSATVSSPSSPTATTSERSPSTTSDIFMTSL